MRNLLNPSAQPLPLPKQSDKAVPAEIQGIDKFAEHLKSVERNLQRERQHPDGTMMGVGYDS